MYSDRVACPRTIHLQGSRGRIFYIEHCRFTRRHMALTLPYADTEPRSAHKQILLYNSYRASLRQRDRATPNSPSVGSSDSQGRQGTYAWCARGRARARRCGNSIGPKVSLERVDGMSMSGLSGSTTSPLTIDGTMICESDSPLCSGGSYLPKCCGCLT